MKNNLVNFQLKAVCALSDPQLESIETIIDAKSEKHYRVGQKPLTDAPSGTARILNTVIGEDGLPWNLGCYYLTYLTVYEVDLTSISKYATSLSEFYDFCRDGGFDPLLDIPSKRNRPIFRFRDHLQRSVRDGLIGDSTANGKIGDVVRFFRWLMEDQNYSFKNPPFTNNSMFISFGKGQGKIGHKLVVSTDARIKTFPKPMLPSEDVIMDDGRLRPLPTLEQEALINILENHKNREMVLIFLFALSTGARIQSVLTLRHQHFRVEADPNSCVPLATGWGTLVDTKAAKKDVLMIPPFIQNALAIYSHSERANNLFKKYCAKRKILPTDEALGECYLFLTNQGNPLYDSKADLKTFDPTQNRATLRLGDNVRKFIERQILPIMRKQFGEAYHFQFHDLRATYGMNLVDECNKLVSKGEMDASAVLPYVQTRLNHTDSKITERYLGFRKRNQQTSEILATYQDTLQDRIALLLNRGVND